MCPSKCLETKLFNTDLLFDIQKISQIWKFLQFFLLFYSPLLNLFSCSVIEYWTPNIIVLFKLTIWNIIFQTDVRLFIHSTSGCESESRAWFGCEAGAWQFFPPSAKFPRSAEDSFTQLPLETTDNRLQVRDIRCKIYIDSRPEYTAAFFGLLGKGLTSL